MTGYGNIQLVTIFAMKYGKNNHQLRDSTVKSFLIISQVFTYYKHTVYATWSMGHIQTITLDSEMVKSVTRKSYGH